MPGVDSEKCWFTTTFMSLAMKNCFQSVFNKILPVGRTFYRAMMFFKDSKTWSMNQWSIYLIVISWQSYHMFIIIQPELFDPFHPFNPLHPSHLFAETIILFWTHFNHLTRHLFENKVIPKPPNSKFVPKDETKKAPFANHKNPPIRSKSFVSPPGGWSTKHRFWWRIFSRSFGDFGIFSDEAQGASGRRTQRTLTWGNHPSSTSNLN